MSSDEKLGINQFPLSRIRLIMKSSPDVSQISTETLFLIGKSAELFVSFLAKETYVNCRSNIKNNDGKMSYKHLADMINDSELLEPFLGDIIPKQIKYKDVLELRKQKQNESELDEED